MTTTTPIYTTAPATFAGAHLVGYTEHPRKSRETTDFDAEVHINGQRVGILSNDGHGGANDFLPDSAEGNAAFQEARKSFGGITDTEHGYVNDLSDTLAEAGALAKQLGGRTVTFVPDATPDEVLSAPTFPGYAVPARLADDLDAVLSMLVREMDAKTLLYPVKEKKGHWLYVASASN